MIDAVRGIAQWLLVLPLVLTMWIVVTRLQWQVDIIEGALASVLTVAPFRQTGGRFVCSRRGLLSCMVVCRSCYTRRIMRFHRIICRVRFGVRLYLATKPGIIFHRSFIAALIGAAPVLAGLH